MKTGHEKGYLTFNIGLLWREVRGADRNLPDIGNGDRRQTGKDVILSLSVSARCSMLVQPWVNSTEPADHKATTTRAIWETKCWSYFLGQCQMIEQWLIWPRTWQPGSMFHALKPTPCICVKGKFIHNIKEKILKIMNGELRVAFYFLFLFVFV